MQSGGIKAGEPHHRQILVISRFVLGTDRKKQEWCVIGVDWQTFSLVEGRFALNLSTLNLSRARANVVAARHIRFPMVPGWVFPSGD